MDIKMGKNDLPEQPHKHNVGFNKEKSEISNNLHREQPSTSTKSVNHLIKLTERTKSICDKLTTKRLQLIEKTKKRNNDEIKENDMRAFKALTFMGIKKQTVVITQSGVSNSNLVHLNGIVERPISGHSKKQLESIVEGLQELICKLTLNDKSLKFKAEKIARNIKGLRNFHIFPNGENVLSSSGTRIQNNESEYYDIENSEDEKKQIATKQRNNSKKVSPAEMFVKYINGLLAEYFGDVYKDKLDVYKCTPADLEDLESFSKLLVQEGIGRIVEAKIRINRKNNRQSFVALSEDRETSEKDAIILLPVARRYAFEGDLVRAFLLNPVSAIIYSNSECNDSTRKVKKIYSHNTGENNSQSLAEDEEIFEDIDASSLPESDNEENDIMENSCKAFVIKILKQTELREVVGSISFTSTTTINSKLYYKLRPHDIRIPMIYIPKECCVEETKSKSEEDVCGMLYVARVLETDNSGHCIGELVQPVGKAGNLQAEIKAILLHNGLKDIKPYDQKFHAMYEGPMPLPSDKELKYREDLRNKCVFTIDPITAKDLDDALSIEKLNNLEYEIGVHISDVSFYLEENSELDNLVKYRATSIYLVNEVIHMLPPSLCFRCSLMPGEDKYTFSVFWKWHIEKEELSEPRFTRSIINSCSQFAYEHAQKIIDNPMEDVDSVDIPDLLNKWKPNDIKWRVLVLHQIAQKLKMKRFKNGALPINNPKLHFELEPKTGEPLSYEIETRQEANFLVEEFMLLANQSVASFIHKTFPEISILRHHPPPLLKYLKALKDRLKNIGLEFDINSSKSIYESMQRLSREAGDSKAVDACLSTLLTKPMTRARYFCSEGKTSDADFWHYALSIPIYTHFTSPIRRYADIMVHRLLAAALNYCPPPKRTPEELHALARICNDQRNNAKNAGDESIELFFKRYLKAKQSITLKAVVTDIYKHTLNVVTIETGHNIQIAYKAQKVLVDATNVPISVCITEKNSKLPPIKLQLFSTVNVNIVLRHEKICGFLATPDLKQRRLNSKESSKKDKCSNYNNFDINFPRVRNCSDSISEQEDDNTQRRKQKCVITKKQGNNRVYALINDE